VRITRPFSWLSKFTRAVQQPDALELLPVIQPVIDVTCDWPLKYIEDVRTGTLGVGTNNFFFLPGPDPTPTAYPAQDPHHALFLWMVMTLSAPLGGSLFVRDFVKTYTVGRIAAIGATTSAFPLEDYNRSPYIAFPYCLHLQILAAAGTETYTIRGIRWDRRGSEPLIL